MALPVSLGALRGLVKELQVSAREGKPLVVGGARELAAVLRRELEKGAKPGAIRESDDPRGGAVFVYVLGRASTEDDEQALKRARRARVPIVAVAAGRGSDDASIPFVLATDVVRVGAGQGFPIAAIARVIAARLGEEGAPLASRVPVLRGPVCDVLVASFARRCGMLAAAVFVPQRLMPPADLPVLALNQVRMVLRLEQAYGLDADPRARAPELLATIAAGLGLRSLARRLLTVVPVAGWALKGAVAYAGTRSLGEATVKRLDSGTPGGDGAGPATRRQAGASRGAP